MDAETLLMRFEGMMLFGKGDPLSGSIMGVGVAEKSPIRCAAVNTIAVAPLSLTDRIPSYPNRKNVLSLRIGPETTAPNWFRRRMSFGKGSGRK